MYLKERCKAWILFNDGVDTIVDLTTERSDQPVPVFNGIRRALRREFDEPVDLIQGGGHAVVVDDNAGGIFCFEGRHTKQVGELIEANIGIHAGHSQEVVLNDGTVEDGIAVWVWG